MNLEQYLNQLKTLEEKTGRQKWQIELTPQGPCGQMVYADAILLKTKIAGTQKGYFFYDYQSAIFADRNRPKWRDELRLAHASRNALPILIQLIEKLIEQRNHSRTDHWDGVVPNHVIEDDNEELEAILKGASNE